MKCIYHAFINHVSRYSLDQKKVSSRSRLGHSRVSSRSRLGQFGTTSRSRLGLGSSGLGLGLGLDPEGLEPIPAPSPTNGTLTIFTSNSPIHISHICKILNSHLSLIVDFQSIKYDMT